MVPHDTHNNTTNNDRTPTLRLQIRLTEPLLGVGPAVLEAHGATHPFEVHRVRGVEQRAEGVSVLNVCYRQEREDAPAWSAFVYVFVCFFWGGGAEKRRKGGVVSFVRVS